MGDLRSKVKVIVIEKVSMIVKEIRQIFQCNVDVFVLHYPVRLKAYLRKKNRVNQPFG